MNIDNLKSWVETAGGVLATFKALKELLPAGPKRDDVERLIERAERELKLADASAARELGFFLCRRHFPPGIMLDNDDDDPRCQTCGKPPPPQPPPIHHEDF